MKRPTLIIFALAVITASCSQKVTRVDTQADPLYRFFHQCELDLDKAAEVVIEKDIVKTLSHLHRMDAGGKKFYLLERENITAMINAVTQGVYSDYILVTENGTVIYTKNNDEIFGQNVRGGALSNTPVSRAYAHRNTVHLEDAVRISSSDPNFYFYISRKVSGNNSFPGVLILQIDATAAAKVIDRKTEGINSRGHVKLSQNPANLNQLSTIASQINLMPPAEDRDAVFTVNSPKLLSYRYFSYRNLSWVLVTAK